MAVGIFIGGMALDWKAEAERLKFDQGKSWSEVYKALAPCFPDLTAKQVEEKVRGYLRTVDRYKSTYPVGVFSDMHEPFGHPDYPYFLRETFEKHKVSKIICLGDGFDSHAISSHDPEPCAYGMYTETDMAIQRLKIYYNLFNDVIYVPGNHDLRIARMAAKMGIGQRFLKPLHDILEMPDGWKVVDDQIELDGVLYTHGENCAGKNGALNKAIQERMSVCTGHSHSFGGVQYNVNRHDRIFGMNVGCGINEDAYAFAYGKHAKQRSTLGCGIVFSKDSAMFCPM